jgi:hypothetical protein
MLVTWCEKGMRVAYDETIAGIGLTDFMTSIFIVEIID